MRGSQDFRINGINSKFLPKSVQRASDEDPGLQFINFNNDAAGGKSNIHANNNHKTFNVVNGGVVG